VFVSHPSLIKMPGNTGNFALTDIGITHHYPCK
jgi:hypothetical protein